VRRFGRSGFKSPDFTNRPIRRIPMPAACRFRPGSKLIALLGCACTHAKGIRPVDASASRSRFPGYRVFLTLLVTAVGLLASACDSGSAPAPVEVHVQVFRDAACAVEHIAVPCAEVGSHLREMCAQKACRVLLEVDTQAPFDVVGETLHSLQNTGIADVRFAPRRSRS
jgi:biopolymer transport protein ExbD